MHISVRSENCFFQGQSSNLTFFSSQERLKSISLSENVKNIFPEDCSTNYFHDLAKKQINTHLIKAHFRNYVPIKASTENFDDFLQKQLFDNSQENFKVCQKFFRTKNQNLNNSIENDLFSSISVKNQNNPLLKFSDKCQNSELENAFKQAYQNYKNTFYSKSQPQKSKMVENELKRDFSNEKRTYFHSNDPCSNSSKIQEKEIIWGNPDPFRLSIDHGTLKEFNTEKENKKSEITEKQNFIEKYKKFDNISVTTQSSCIEIFKDVKLISNKPIVERKIYKLV